MCAYRTLYTQTDIYSVIFIYCNVTIVWCTKSRTGYSTLYIALLLYILRCGLATVVKIPDSSRPYIYELHVLWWIKWLIIYAFTSVGIFCVNPIFCSMSLVWNPGLTWVNPALVFKLSMLIPICSKDVHGSCVYQHHTITLYFHWLGVRQKFGWRRFGSDEY